MRLSSLLFFEISSAVLATGGAVHGLPELSIVAVVLAGLAVAMFALGPPLLAHVMLGLYGITVCLFGLFRFPPLLCAGALAAALIGWDAALAAPSVARASPDDRRRFAIAYTLRSAALVAVGILLVAAAGTIRVSLTFGTGFGLSFVVLVLAALFLRTLRGANTSSDGNDPSGSE